MKRLKIPVLTVTMFLLLGAMQVGGNFIIEPASKLKLSGTTNINSFSCDCGEKFAPLPFSMSFGDHRKKSIYFQNTVLKIRSKSFDCGQSAINNDMYKTLKADKFPHLAIQIVEAHQNSKLNVDECSDWVNMTGVVLVTIANTTRAMQLPVKAKKLSDTRYHFKGITDIKMTDFNLTPPTAMMGLIKVRETISIQLDLVVSVN